MLVRKLGRRGKWLQAKGVMRDTEALQHGATELPLPSPSNGSKLSSRWKFTPKILKEKLLRWEVAYKHNEEECRQTQKGTETILPLIGATDSSLLINSE